MVSEKFCEEVLAFTNMSFLPQALLNACEMNASDPDNSRAVDPPSSKTIGCFVATAPASLADAASQSSADGRGVA
jgi:hypothetical protein